MNNFMSLGTTIIGIYVFIFGLCIGSFLNVAILRGLSGEDMVFARSKCPKCQNQLKWYMNIPLFSYLFLRGRCGFCKEPISFQYPLVEFICGTSFLVNYLVFGFTLKTLLLCLIFANFITLAATDIKETVIIESHAYTLLGFSLIYSYFNLGDANIIQAIIGAIVGFCFFEILARIGILLTNCRLFGEGDSLIALGLGAIFGAKNLLIVIALSFVIQCVSAIPVLIKNAFLQNKFKLGLAYIFVAFFGLIILLLNYMPISRDSLWYILFVILASIALVWSMFVILFEIKEKKVLLEQKLEEENQEKSDSIEDIESQSEFCMMPFGPALVFASAICIYFLKPIKEYVLNFIS